MALYAMGDFHLSFSAERSQEMFGDVWKDHEEKIAQYCREIIKPADTFVITGDHSWGRRMEECRLDLEFIASLPGRKILLRGNHDRFWRVSKTEKLNEEYAGRLAFLQNNYYAYGEYALVGSKGRCYEERDNWKSFVKVRNREITRLEKSFYAAKKDGFQKYIMFLHYPPTAVGEKESPFTKMAEEYGVEKVIYSHCHGTEHYDDGPKGFVNGIEYRLVSSDYLGFCPELVLE